MASRITDVQEFLRKSREEYTQDSLRDKIDRDEAEADNDFANSTDASKSQWNPEARRQREEAGRAVLQFNRIPTYLQHIANAGRQNKPSIKITAGDDGKPETAEMLEARIRFIEYDSDASTVYDTARDQQVASGRGFIRILTEETEDGRQVARLARIENQFSVLWGPHRKYDASDADRCWVVSRISRDEHRRRYGKNSLLNQADFAPYTGDEDWNNLGPENDMVQIAEKFVKEYEPDGSCVVCCYVINGYEILSEGQFIVDDIPIVPQWGREAVVKGVMRHLSLHNPGKDWQRLINLTGSNLAELIAKQPKNRYRAALGSIPKHLEDAYGSNSPAAILYYLQRDPESREPFVPPEVETSEPAIQAAAELLQISIEGLKASMGIYDASMGQRSNETSGVAINRRKVEGEVTNYHFPGNEERTRKRVGQILIKMISVLDKDREQIPIRHENGKTELVPLNRPYEHPRTKKTIIHTLSDADYGVEVESGPSYPNAMEQKLEAEQALITAVPELMLTELGVNMIRNSGRPGANEDADALERYINLKSPGLIPDKDDQQQIPPQVQAQMVAMQQKLKTTEAFAQSLHEQIQTKTVENQAKLEMQREALAFEKYKLDQQEETKRVLGLAKIQSDEALAKLEAELGIVHKRVEMGHERDKQEREHQHASETMSAQQEHEAMQAEAAREAEPVGAEA